jgi:large conductance mechanosensitive channel
MGRRFAATMKEFQAFALRGNAIDLAIAVVLGIAFGAVITSLVNNLLTPLIAAIFGTANFASLTFTINHSVFSYGLFLNAMISFACIAAAVFFFVVKPMSVLRRRLGWDPPEAPARSACPKCTTDIAVVATRCPACTSELGLGWSPTAGA